MSKWKPIETAPKDGEQYLFYVVNGRFSYMTTALWHDNMFLDTNQLLLETGATYWMPLPDRPGSDDMSDAENAVLHDLYNSP